MQRGCISFPEGLSTLSISKEHFKQPAAQRSLERAQTFKRLITRVEEAFVFQDESRQVVPLLPLELSPWRCVQNCFEATAPR
jgi:hypothetical protein